MQTQNILKILNTSKFLDYTRDKPLNEHLTNSNLLPTLQCTLIAHNLYFRVLYIEPQTIAFIYTVELLRYSAFSSSLNINTLLILAIINKIFEYIFNIHIQIFETSSLPYQLNSRARSRPYKREKDHMQISRQNLFEVRKGSELEKGWVEEVYAPSLKI